MISPKQLDEAERLATLIGEPWYMKTVGYEDGGARYYGLSYIDGDSLEWNKDKVEFCLMARTFVPEAVARIRALEAMLQRWLNADPDECQLDASGDCTSHVLGHEPCIHAETKALLKPAEAAGGA